MPRHRTSTGQAGRHPLTLYLREMAAHPRVSRTEERELGRRIRAGDPEAFQRLVAANLRLVVSIAKQSQRDGYDLLDLIQEGNIGLMVAARRYDPERTNTFATYAIWWIRQRIWSFIADTPANLIRLPRKVYADLSSLLQRRTSLAQELGRAPTSTELAAATGKSRDEVDTLLLLSLPPESLDEPVDSEDGPRFHEFLPSPGADPGTLVDEAARPASTAILLAALPERERTVLILRFGLDGEEPRSLEATGAIVGKTRERVRQIQDAALKRLGRTPSLRSLARNLGLLL